MRYRTDTGTIEMIVCGECGLELHWTEWKDGARTARCENGHEPFLQIDQGELDLGLLRAEMEKDGITVDDVTFFGPPPLG